MAKYTVYAHETVYESCEVEADSPEEAIRLVREGDEAFVWEVYDGEDFEIENAEFSKEQ